MLACFLCGYENASKCFPVVGRMLCNGSLQGPSGKMLQTPPRTLVLTPNWSQPKVRQIP